MPTVTWLMSHGLLLGPAALVATIVVATGLWWAAARLHAVVAGRTARRAAEPLEGDLDSVDDGQTVTLTGTVCVTEGARQRPEDGHEAAVITVANSRRRLWFVLPKIPLEASWRAAGLTLTVRGTPVVLEGPIEIELGSREWWPAVALSRLPAAAATRLPHDELEQSSFSTMQDSFGVFRSVADGDEVLVRGALRRRGGELDREGAGYRKQDARWQLAARAGQSAIHLSATGSPRPSLPLGRLLRTPAVLVAGIVPLLALTLGAFRLSGEEVDCLRSAPCVHSGRCEAAVAELWPMRFVCRATRPEHCTRSAECKVSGQCSLRSNHCEAAGDDCRRSVLCHRSGLCSVADGECAALSDGDCAESVGCRDEGACLARQGECAQSPARKCSSHFACQRDGRCTYRDEHCVIGGTEDCARSTGCSQHGHCSLERLDDGLGLQCIAATDEDCAKAAVCTRFGGCRAQEGRCMAKTDADCASAQVCQYQKLCLARDGHCVDGKGRNACQASPECAEEGRCSPQGLHCTAGSDRDCRQSANCPQAGLCRASKGRCIAGTDADCQQAEACTMHGACTAADGSCQSHAFE